MKLGFEIAYVLVTIALIVTIPFLFALILPFLFTVAIDFLEVL